MPVIMSHQEVVNVVVVVVDVVVAVVQMKNNHWRQRTLVINVLSLIFNLKMPQSSNSTSCRQGLCQGRIGRRRKCGPKSKYITLSSSSSLFSSTTFDCLLILLV